MAPKNTTKKCPKIKPAYAVFLLVVVHDAAPVAAAAVEHQGELLQVGLEALQGGEEEAAHLVVDAPAAVQSQPDVEATDSGAVAFLQQKSHFPHFDCQVLFIYIW